MEERIKLIEEAGCSFGREAIERIKNMQGKQETDSAAHNLLLQTMKEKMNEMVLVTKDLDTRMDKLEKNLTWLLGAYTVIGGIIGFLAGKFF